MLQRNASKRKNCTTIWKLYAQFYAAFWTINNTIFPHARTHASFASYHIRKLSPEFKSIEMHRKTTNIFATTKIIVRSWFLVKGCLDHIQTFLKSTKNDAVKCPTNLHFSTLKLKLSEWDLCDANLTRGKKQIFFLFILLSINYQAHLSEMEKALCLYFSTKLIQWFKCSITCR